MKKILSLLLIMSASLCSAQTDASDITAVDQPFKAERIRKDLQVNNSEITVQPVSNAVQPRRASLHKTSSISSISDLEGGYLMTYSSATGSSSNNVADEGVTIEVQDADTIVINDFWSSGLDVKAAVDLDEMTITIPNQVVGYSSTYGYYDLCSTTTGSPDRDTPITGTISSDGTITLSSYWGIYIVEGDYANYYFTDLYGGTTIEPANATMTYYYYSSGTTYYYTFPVIVEQETTSSVSVRNFYNACGTVDVTLSSDSIPTIAQQTIYSNSYGDWYSVGVTYASGYSGLSSYTSTITCDAYVDSRTITWGDWNMLCSYNGSLYWTGVYFTGGTITTDFDIEYPSESEESVTLNGITGDGTADAPYQITTVEEWNTFAEYIVSQKDDISSRYVKIMNDIDFTGSTLTPFSYDGATPFNGDLDGGGYTLSGISATADATYYGALINITGEDANIHDITVAGTFTTAYDYTGGFVGRLYGTLSNVVSNMTVTVETDADYTGGLVGYSSYAKINSCTFNGEATVNGNTFGAISGYNIHTAHTDCANKGTITAAGDYIGGIAGASYQYCTFTNCRNEGTVTNTAEYTSGVSAVIYHWCSLTDCYNAGTVSGTSYVGGLVAYASSTTPYDTIRTSYNKGEVVGTLYTGGIIGRPVNVYMYDCYNAEEGTVSGDDTTGGLIGYSYWARCTGCNNYGTVTATGDFTGGLFGLDCYYTKTNCYNYGSVSSSGSYLGGLTGRVIFESKFIDCGNYGTVTYTGSNENKGYIAGLVGYLYASAAGTFTRCFNEGVVSATCDNVSYIAGLFGYVYASDDLYITECWNSADITGGSHVAGVTPYVSYPFGSLEDEINFVDCYNTGNITSTDTSLNENDVPTVGVIGVYPDYCTISGCWNSGNITSLGSNTAGGVLGESDAGGFSADSLRVENCWNTGDISSAGYPVGGVMARLDARRSIIEGCWNTGNVSGSSYAGGVLGYNYYYYNAADGVVATDTIADCWNAGNITVATAYAGGIVGYASKMTDIYNCFNTGDVTSESTTVGSDDDAGYAVGGIVGYTPAAVYDVYNTGNVAGANAVGSIVGMPVVEETSVARAYSTGQVSLTVSSGVCGNIIGVNTHNTTYWTHANSMSDTYYLADKAADGGATDTYSQDMTVAELTSLDLGDAWTAGDDYTYPRITSVADNDYAVAYAAAVVPADGDTYDNITGSFYVGNPDGVSWTTSQDVITIDGNDAVFTSGYEGSMTMTATAGDVTVSTELTCNVVVTAIENIDDSEKTVVDETYYTPAGVRVAEPTSNKSLYIVVRTYDDGTTATSKEIR